MLCIVWLLVLVHAALVSSDNAECKPKLVALPARGGVGHNVMSLVTGMRAARALNMTLYLDSEFWAGNDKNLVVGGTYHRIATYFPTFEYVTTTNLTVAATDMKNLTLYFESECHEVVGALFGHHFCNGYCSAVPGSYDRAAEILVPPPLPALPAEKDHKVRKKPSQFVDVYWHLRTGDITVQVHPDNIQKLRKTIDSYFSNRIPRHFILTQNKTQALGTFECQHKKAKLKRECAGNYTMHGFEIIDRYNITEVINQLLAADVIVSMGSSGTYIAPLLQSHKKLVHFYFPPKESYWKLNGAHRTDLTTEAAITKTMHYRNYFMRKGVIPVIGERGEIFNKYEHKMKMLLQHVDHGEDIPYNISMQHYENWLPYGYNPRAFDLEPESEW